MRPAAEAREDRAARANPAGAACQALLVTETSHEELESTERCWEQTASQAWLSPEVPK
jgi:hypothetical protein